MPNRNLLSLISSKRMMFVIVVLLGLGGGVFIGVKRSSIHEPIYSLSIQTRIGMPSAEVAEMVIRIAQSNVDAIYVRGTTMDGKPFSGIGTSAMKELASKTQIQQAQIEIDDEEGHEFVITIENGLVSSFRVR